MSNERDKKANGSNKRKAQTFDAETGKPEPTPRRIDLSTYETCAWNSQRSSGKWTRVRSNPRTERGGPTCSRRSMT